MARPLTSRPCPTAGTGRSTASTLSLPHTPQPVRPEMRRVRLSISAMQAVATVTCISIPRACGSAAIDVMSSTDPTRPSVRLKPVTKSMRFVGVVIMTTCGTSL